MQELDKLKNNLILKIIKSVWTIKSGLEKDFLNAMNVNKLSTKEQKTMYIKQ